MTYAPNQQMVSVTYRTCSCEWESNYCDEYHQRLARIPILVLEKYVV